MREKLPTVAIIFPNYNGGSQPIDCIKSIKRLNYPQNKISIWVIDNKSWDSSPEKIEKLYPDVNLIRLNKNSGYSRSINKGIKKSKSEFIVAGNDDIIFGRESLKDLVLHSLKRPKIGVLGGKIFYKSHPKKVANMGYKMNYWTGNIYPLLKASVSKSPDWIQGCTMLIPRGIIKKIGMFDEGYTHTFEDYDFCFKVKKAGYKISIVPTAYIWHAESISTDKNKPFKYLNWYKGKIRFVLRNMPLLNKLSILFIQTFIVMPYRLLILRDGKFTIYLRALIWNFNINAKTFF